MRAISRTLFTALQQLARGEQIPADLRFRLSRLGLVDTVGLVTPEGRSVIEGNARILGVEVG